jgi:hypothetical protein
MEEWGGKGALPLGRVSPRQESAVELDVERGSEEVDRPRREEEGDKG